MSNTDDDSAASAGFEPFSIDISAQSLVIMLRKVLGDASLWQFPTKEGWLEFSVEQNLYDDWSDAWSSTELSNSSGRPLPPKPPNAQAGEISVRGVTEATNDVYTQHLAPLLATLHVVPYRNNTRQQVRCEHHATAFESYLATIYTRLRFEGHKTKEQGAEPSSSIAVRDANILRGKEQGDAAEGGSGPGGRAYYSIEQQDEMVENWYRVKKQGATHRWEFITQHANLTEATFGRYVTAYNKRHRPEA